MIKRYRHWLGEEAHHMVESFDGDYVLYTDHIAAIAEKDREIKELKVLIDGAMDVVTLFYPATEAQKRWRETWLKDAYEAVKKEDGDDSAMEDFRQPSSGGD